MCVCVCESSTATAVRKLISNQALSNFRPLPPSARRMPELKGQRLSLSQVQMHCFTVGGHRLSSSADWFQTSLRLTTGHSSSNMPTWNRILRRWGPSCREWNASRSLLSSRVTGHLARRARCIVNPSERVALGLQIAVNMRAPS